MTNVVAVAHADRGQLVEVPQIEAFMQLMATEILDYTMNGRAAGPMGNDHRSHAPHGAYPCRPLPNPSPALRERGLCGEASSSPLPRSGGGAGGGGGVWIAIHVESDAQWTALCRVLGAGGLAADARFADMPSRRRNRRELDLELGKHTRGWDRIELFQALQAVGVPAGPVQDDAECFRCPQLEARGFFQEQTREDIGTHRYPGMLFQWKDTPNRHRRPPVKLGQDNEYVYRTLLGLTAGSYQALMDAGEVGTTYALELVRSPAGVQPATPSVP